MPVYIISTQKIFFIGNLAIRILYLMEIDVEYLQTFMLNNISLGEIS